MPHETSVLLQGDRPVMENVNKWRQVVLPGLPMVLVMATDGAFSIASYSSIGSEFKQRENSLWLAVAYQICVIVGQTIYSRLSDWLGRKSTLLIAHTIFLLGLFLTCFIVTSFWHLVIARAIVGAGASGMTLMLSTILNDITPAESRPRWQMPIVIFNTVGQFTGGIVEGYIKDRFGWKQAYMVEFLISVASIFIILLFLRYPEERVEIDSCNFLGAIPLALSLSSFVLVLNSKLPTSWPLTLATVCLLFFVYSERRAKNSLIPWEIFERQSVPSVMIIAFFTAIFDMSILYLVPFYLLASAKGEVMASGFVGLIFGVGTIAGMALGSSVESGQSPWLVLRASRFAACLGALVLFVGNDWVKVADIFVAGTATGAANAASIVMLMKNTCKKDKAITYGVYHLVIAFGDMISQSLVSAVLEHLAVSQLMRDLVHDVPSHITRFAKRCLESFQYVQDLPENVQLVVRRAFLKAIEGSFAFAWLISLVAVTFSLFSPPDASDIDNDNQRD